MNKNLLHKKELEFFGKITACISHELNNVLSIINEYTGLLEDLMLTCGDGKTFEFFFQCCQILKQTSFFINNS